MSDVGGPSSPNQPRSMISSFKNLIRSDSFLEKTFLLCLTALISGIAVPLIISRLTEQSTIQQKEIDRARVRNEAIQQARSKLLQEFAEVAIGYQVLALDVSWFGTSEVRNEALQNRAIERYNTRSAEYLARWWVLISQTRILASPAVADKMQKLLDIVYIQDADIMAKHIRLSANQDGTTIRHGSINWLDVHNKHWETLHSINTLLMELANDLGLVDERIVRSP